MWSNDEIKIKMFSSFVWLLFQRKEKVTQPTFWGNQTRGKWNSVTLADKWKIDDVDFEHKEKPIISWLLGCFYFFYFFSLLSHFSYDFVPDASFVGHYEI